MGKQRCDLLFYYVSIVSHIKTTRNGYIFKTITFIDGSVNEKIGN